MEKIWVTILLEKWLKTQCCSRKKKTRSLWWGRSTWAKGSSSAWMNANQSNRWAYSLSMFAGKHTYHVALTVVPYRHPTPFILTPASLLPNHTLITDVQQIIGRNGQQWIKCTTGTSGTSGREGTGVHIHSAVNGAIIEWNRMSTAKIGLGRYPSNGLYYCSEGQAPRYYLSLFPKNPSKSMAY